MGLPGRRPGTGRPPARTSRSSSRSAPDRIPVPGRCLPQRPRDHATDQQHLQQPCLLNASQLVQNPAQDATRAAMSPPSAAANRWTAGQKAWQTSQATKLPENEWCQQLRFYQELCSISGTTANHHNANPNAQPTCYPQPETGQQAPYPRKLKGSPPVSHAHADSGMLSGETSSTAATGFPAARLPLIL